MALARRGGDERRRRAAAVDGQAEGGTGGVLVDALECPRHLLLMRRFCKPMLSRYDLACGSCHATDHCPETGEHEAETVPLVVGELRKKHRPAGSAAAGSDRLCAVERCWSSVGAIPTRQLGRSSR